MEITSDSDFYGPLSPYGSWETIDGYGTCWVPSGVGPDWEPYEDGSWISTDGGWYWESGFDRDPIADMEYVRDWNFRAMYGAWDALKNVVGAFPDHRLGWSADYVLVINDADTAGDLVGWVTLNNTTGTAYENAKLKLVAGDVQRVAPPGYAAGTVPAARMALEVAAMTFAFFVVASLVLGLLLGKAAK